MCYLYRLDPLRHPSDDSGMEARNDVECICERCETSSTVSRTTCTFPQQQPQLPVVVSAGDIVTIELCMTPENGFVPEPLFDTEGIVSFVVGWGNYLPALHTLVQGKSIGQQVLHVSIDAGWGERDPNLVMELPKSKLKGFINEKDGSLPPMIHLQGGQLQLTVLRVDEENETVVVDANNPLSGASYDCSFKILNIEPLPSQAVQHTKTDTTPQEQQSSRYQVATFALGCFWGGELAFMRVPGVVGTRVGYSQGIMSNPKYEDVCTGRTQHREAIMVIFDPAVVSYKELLQVALKRLQDTKTLPENSPPGLFLDMFEEDDDVRNNKQYRHGIYYHTTEQYDSAKVELSPKNPYDIELKKAAEFYDAEEYHQQYLLKGGQSAKKGAKETIRCYG